LEVLASLLDLVVSPIIDRINSYEGVICNTAQEHLMIRVIQIILFIFNLSVFLLEFYGHWFGLAGECEMVDSVVICMETREVLFSLRYGHSRQRVTRMINIGTLRRLVFQPTGSLLAAENDVSLEGLLVEQVLAIDIHFEALLLRQYIHEFKTCADPKAITTIDKLVDAAVEASQFLELSIGQPFCQLVEIDLLVVFISNFAEQYEACKGAESVAAVCLSIWRTRKTAFISLAA